MLPVTKRFYKHVLKFTDLCHLFCCCCFFFFIERKKETEKLAVLPKKSSARRQKTLQTEKVGG